MDQVMHRALTVQRAQQGNQWYGEPLLAATAIGNITPMNYTMTTNAAPSISYTAAALK